MNYTDYLKLNLPTATTVVDIGDLNENTIKIDEELKRLKTELENAGSDEEIQQIQKEIESLILDLQNLEENKADKEELKEVEKLASKNQASISAEDSTEEVTTNHTRQVNASWQSEASGNTSQVNASSASEATSNISQVNASSDSKASGVRSQVSASRDASTNANVSAVIASKDSSINDTDARYVRQVVMLASNEFEFDPANANDNKVVGGYRGDLSWMLDSRNGEVYAREDVYTDTKSLNSLSKSSTIVIANYDSHDNSKKAADIVIDRGENAATKINEAIQSLEGIGGEVKLLEGNYNLEYGIAVNVDGVHLTGIPKATVLVQNSNWKGNPYADDRKSIVDTWRESDREGVDVEISNIYVKGAKVSSSNGFSCYGISTINNCISENSGNNGFYCDDSSKIVNCISEGSSSNGFSCYSSSKIINCMSENSDSNGFYCDDSSKIVNCISEGSSSNGFSCYSSSKIINCMSENSDSNGFSCYGSSTVNNCTSKNSGNNGFHCWDSSTVNNCTSENSGSQGFSCYGSSTVNNCTSKNSGNNGFYCDDSSKIVNCISEGSSSNGFYCTTFFEGVCGHNTLVGDKFEDSSESPAIVQYNIIQEGV